MSPSSMDRILSLSSPEETRDALWLIRVFETELSSEDVSDWLGWILAWQGLHELNGQPRN